MNPKLPMKTKVAYGVADLGISLLTASIQFFLLFYYTDILGIDPGLAGTALLVGKLTWDAINDRSSVTFPTAPKAAGDGENPICSLAQSPSG
jgi:Na+/melibiose symporter-like transporter